MSRGSFVAALMLAAVLAGAALGLAQRPTAIQSAPAPSVDVPQVEMMEIHVAGWVAHPGVVSLAQGSIVADAVAAAGGMRPGARGDLLNLAAPLSPGEQVVVPAPDATGGPVASDDGRVALNRAGSAELQDLPGVGPVLADRIVAWRDQHGPFQRVEDLLQVPGIGESKLAALRDLVTLP